MAGTADGTAHVRGYSPDGALRWTARVGPAKGDKAHGVATGRSGVYVVTGGVFPGERDGRGSDAFLVRYDLAGRFLWARQIAGTDARVCLAGDVGGDGGVWRLRPNGRVRWSATIGVRGWGGFNGVTTRGSEVYLVGYTRGGFPDQPLAGGEWDLVIAVLGHDEEVHRSCRSVARTGSKAAASPWAPDRGSSRLPHPGPCSTLPTVGGSMLVLAISR